MLPVKIFPGFPAIVVRLPSSFGDPHTFEMFAAFLAALEIPEQPIIIGYKFIPHTAPFSRQALVEFGQERQKWTFGFESPLVPIQRDVLGPAETFAKGSEAESVEEILAPHQRDVPQAGN